MSEQEIKSFRKLFVTVVIALATNIIVIFGVVWWASSIDLRVTKIEKDEVMIKETMIPTTSWTYNDYFTRYLWAERWGQPLPNSPNTSRGQGIAPNL